MGMAHSKAGQVASLDSVRGSSLKGCSPAFFKKKYIYIFIYLFIYLFIFGSAGSSLLCGLFSSCSGQASHCGGFSCCRAGAPGL